MFSSGTSTTANTSLFGQATPINQNRTGTSFLFGNTTTQPSALTSTPLSSSNVFGASTPAVTPFQMGSLSGTGTTQKFDPVLGSEKGTKGNTQATIKTKLMNICGMPYYEKKSMEELRLEDYNEKRKFPSMTTTSTTSAIFGSTNLTATTNTAQNTTANIFGVTSSTPSTIFGSSPFGGQTTSTSSSSTIPFAFGGSTTTTPATTTFTLGSTAPTATTATSSIFGGTNTPAFAFSNTQASTATTSAFTFGGNQASTATTAPTFAFGGSNTMFPTSTTTTSTNPGSLFNFSAPKTNTSTFPFMPTTTTATTSAPSLSLFPNAPTSVTTALNPAVSNTPAIFSSQASVDTRTHLQLLQTMLNIQPFNNEMSFLAKNIKPNIGLDRNRLRTAPEPAAIPNQIGGVFSPLLIKPSVLSSVINTPPSSSSIGNSTLPNHAHTLPTVLLPSSSSITSTSTLGLFGKRKLADSFLDDDDDNPLMMDDGPSTSITKLPKSHIVKRPRVLDMNKIRSVVLGGGNSFSEIPRKGEENPSETFIVKALSTADQTNGWKKFANYDAYLASKKASTNVTTEAKTDKFMPVIKSKIDKDRTFHLPRLTHVDYYTKPSLDELRNYFNKDGQCFVPEFTVGREHYGSVTFRNPKLNLAGLDLDRLIEIGRRQVTVYPDDRDKPIEGDEFNCPAEISLLGVYPMDRSNPKGGVEITDPDRLNEMNYGSYLEQMTKKFQGHFIDYNVLTGTWRFQVDHF